MNRFWIILVAVVVVLVGLFFVTKPDDEGSNTSTEDPAKVTSVDHTKWNTDAKVTLIEYGDFQCSACATYHPILKQLETEYGKDIQFVFRHFPLRNIHPNAQSASLAAEAAGKQGKFWEMHDQLFETQQAWGRISTNLQSQFEDYAQELGLDMDKFRKDYADTATAKRINNDLDTGKSLGATGTPTFILNGKMIETPADATAFGKILDDALKASGNESDTE